METRSAKPGTTRPAPPHRKMAISSGLAVFPVSLLGNAVLGPYLTLCGHTGRKQAAVAPPAHSLRLVTCSSPSAYCLRITFLSNLPTLVFGTAGMIAQRSGSCHFATDSPRNAFRDA